MKKNIIKISIIYICFVTLFSCKSSRIVSQQAEAREFIKNNSIVYLTYTDGKTDTLRFGPDSTRIVYKNNEPTELHNFSYTASPSACIPFRIIVSDVWLFGDQGALDASSVHPTIKTKITELENNLVRVDIEKKWLPKGVADVNGTIIFDKTKAIEEGEWKELGLPEVIPFFFGLFEASPEYLDKVYYLKKTENNKQFIYLMFYDPDAPDLYAFVHEDIKKATDKRTKKPFYIDYDDLLPGFTASKTVEDIKINDYNCDSEMYITRMEIRDYFYTDQDYDIHIAIAAYYTVDPDGDLFPSLPFKPTPIFKISIKNK